MIDIVQNEYFEFVCHGCKTKPMTRLESVYRHIATKHYQYMKWKKHSDKQKKELLFGNAAKQGICKICKKKKRDGGDVRKHISNVHRDQFDYDVNIVLKNKKKIFLTFKNNIILNLGNIFRFLQEDVLFNYATIFYPEKRLRDRLMINNNNTCADGGLQYWTCRWVIGEEKRKSDITHALKQIEETKRHLSRIFDPPLPVPFAIILLKKLPKIARKKWGRNEVTRQLFEKKGKSKRHFIKLGETVVFLLYSEEKLVDFWNSLNYANIDIYQETLVLDLAMGEQNGHLCRD